MKKISVFVFLALLATFSSVKALTWKELYNAVSPEKYNFPANAKNKNVTCWKRVYWEEYIEGDAYRSGYVKEYRKELKITCPY
tara:strand:- start:5167 stop:5415 length:249 start_codon:yes stop_codon:yes gene_type:complete